MKGGILSSGFLILLKIWIHPLEIHRKNNPIAPLTFEGPPASDASRSVSRKTFARPKDIEASETI